MCFAFALQLLRLPLGLLQLQQTYHLLQFFLTEARNVFRVRSSDFPTIFLQNLKQVDVLKQYYYYY
jgi:hypothetical protein